MIYFFTILYGLAWLLPLIFFAYIGFEFIQMMQYSFWVGILFSVWLGIAFFAIFLDCIRIYNAIRRIQ